MAAVLDAFVSFLIDKVTKMATEEVAMLHGVPGEINKLEEKLQELKAVLADAERRRITEKTVQRWVMMLKDVMYEATDILDICNLKAEERQESSTGVDCTCFVNPMSLCLQSPVFTHNIGSRIKDLNKKLDSICESGAQFNFIRMEQNQDRGMVSHPARGKTSPVMEHSSLVGEKIKEDTVELVNMLTNEGQANHADNYIVIAISGTGGIGKTTLAQNIYNHQTIKEKFRKMIWLSVTQACTETELLRVAITGAGGDYFQAHDKSLLEPALVNLIRDKKIFVVLDDMWTAAEWNNVLRASFSYVARGSRVLVTTRDDRVALAMKARYLHRINYLGPQDAWSLLKKQVVATERDELHIDTLKNIGLAILGRCGGLPLAIKVIGLLRQRCMNMVEWERILNNPAWSIDGMPEELNHAIYLSYDDLPPHLKQCLLYYSLIPQKANVGPDRMIEMWISEGLVSSNYSDDLEQIGADYINELIWRNLIEPYKQYIGHSHYIMHDVVRSFCHYMVGDDALVAAKGESNIGSRLSLQKFRLLSIGVESSFNELDWGVLQKHSSLRTLISFYPIKFKRDDSLSGLSRLRTLYLKNSDFSPLLANHLGGLKHLRFLTIESTEISSLPDSIGHMKLLQYLDLMDCKRVVRLPNGIVKLKKLRSLYLNTTINTIPEKFGALTNLRKITNFPASMDGGSNGWCTLEELGPLSQLMNLGLKGLENVYPSSLAAKAMLSTKMHLCRLIFKCSSIIGDDGWSFERIVTEEEQRHVEEVFDELCPPGCIEHLTIDGYFGRRLPEWVTSMTGSVSLERLRILHLRDLAYCIQLPSGLCHLPCLQTLIVHRAPAIKHVGPELICHNQHHPRVSTSLFPCLEEWTSVECCAGRSGSGSARN